MDAIISKINKRKRRTHEKADERSAGRRSGGSRGVFAGGSGRPPAGARLYGGERETHRPGAAGGAHRSARLRLWGGPAGAAGCGGGAVTRPGTAVRRHRGRRAPDAGGAGAGHGGGPGGGMAHLLCHRQSRVLDGAGGRGEGPAGGTGRGGAGGGLCDGNGGGTDGAALRH